MSNQQTLQARSDKGHTNAHGAPIATRDQQPPDEWDRRSVDHAARRRFWLAYFCVVVPTFIWALLEMAQFIGRLIP